MDIARFASGLVGVYLLAGCGLVSSTGSSLYPPSPPGVGSRAQSKAAQSAAQPQITGAQRVQHVWDKALEGMAFGGALAGPYGAGTGLVIGLLAGLFTADQHYGHLNGQIQAEQAKDKQLEAQIEQELERQRALESQLFNGAGDTAQRQQANQPHPTREPPPPHLAAAVMNGASSRLASLGPAESPSSSTSRPFRNVEVRDVNGDGVPDLWIYYSLLEPGEMVRQEEATRGDGRVDTWSYFKDGKLVRREVDTRGRGAADTVYYYENDKIVREERDQNGSGQVSGRRAKIEEDTNGAGKTDRWIYYDTSTDAEIILKEERDLNGDGTVDLWSHYENGRIVRRDLSAAGLELLTKDEQIAASPAGAKHASEPNATDDILNRARVHELHWETKE